MVEALVRGVPMMKIPAIYVVFKPFSHLETPRERPFVVTFFVQPDQLAALVIPVNCGRDDLENVMISYAAGCQKIGVISYKETASSRPRAVVGLTDISARLYLGGRIPL